MEIKVIGEGCEISSMKMYWQQWKKPDVAQQ